jgi:hypothetical protein
MRNTIVIGFDGSEESRDALPPFHSLLGTAALDASDLLILLPFPFIVWGADELRRDVRRRRRARPASR